MSTCEKYKVSILKGKFRLCQVLKNRIGESNKNIGLLFRGQTGTWSELPKPEEINDYSVYTEEES